MSGDLYPTRLYWHGGRGGARWLGRHIPLQALPQLPGLPGLTVGDLVAIDYAPGVVAMLMERAHGWRDMTTQEVVAVREWLRGAAAAAAAAGAQPVGARPV